MEISLKELKSLAVELSEADNNKGKSILDLDYWCRNSNKLHRENKPLILNAYICLHRRNYRTILVDSSGWIYVQFLNLTESNVDGDSKRIRINQLLNRIRVESFNVIVEILSSNLSSSTPPRKIVYIHTDLTKCHYFNSDQIDWNRLSSDELCQDSAKLSFELLRFFRNSTSQQHSSYFKVESLGQIFSTVSSTQMRHLKAKLRADIKVQLIDEKEPSKRFNFVLSLLGKQLFYYNFLHVGSIYLLKSDKPLKSYLSVFESSSAGNSSVISILQVDDSIRIFDEFNIPKTLASYRDQVSETNFDQNKEFVDQLSGILIDKRLKTNTNLLASESNDLLIDHFEVILPNRELKLVIRPLNCDFTIVVYFETRFCLYELGILPGMKISLMNLNKRQGGEKIYKASLYISLMLDQSANFLSSINNNDESLKSVTNVKKKATLYESLVKMNTIYDSFYKDYTASNITKKQAKNEDETHEYEQKERERLYFRSLNNGGDESSSHQRRILGQLCRIYELHVKITCRKCSRLANACQCGPGSSEWRIEFETTMLIDDHTSIIKLVYSTSDFEPKLSTQSNLFGRMGDYLIRVLGKYLAEISLPSIPLLVTNEGSFDFDTKLQQSIHEKLGSMDQTLNTSHIELNDASSCFHLVKMDIYKALYDYLYYTCIDKYFVFYIDMSDLDNVREMGKLRSSNNQQQAAKNNSTYKPKNEYNHFRLDEINSNEQFKSTLTLRCYKFIPINVDLSDH